MNLQLSLTQAFTDMIELVPSHLNEGIEVEPGSLVSFTKFFQSLAIKIQVAKITDESFVKTSVDPEQVFVVVGTLSDKITYELAGSEQRWAQCNLVCMSQGTLCALSKHSGIEVK